MAAGLMAASGGAEPSQILAAIEVPHGPVVETLIERGFKVHAINPKQMDRFKTPIGVNYSRGLKSRQKRPPSFFCGGKNDSAGILVQSDLFTCDRARGWVT